MNNDTRSQEVSMHEGLERFFDLVPDMVEVEAALERFGEQAGRKFP